MLSDKSDKQQQGKSCCIAKQASVKITPINILTDGELRNENEDLLMSRQIILSHPFEGIQQERILQNGKQEIQNIYSEFLCAICVGIVNNPVMCIHCQQMTCFYCIKKVTDSQGKKQCPTCQRNPADYKPISRLAMNILKSMQIKCTYFTHGCTYKFSYQSGDEHEKNCKFQEIQCPQCNDLVLIKNLSYHIQQKHSDSKKGGEQEEEDSISLLQNQEENIIQNYKFKKFSINTSSSEYQKFIQNSSASEMNQRNNLNSVVVAASNNNIQSIEAGLSQISQQQPQSIAPVTTKSKKKKSSHDSKYTSRCSSMCSIF